MNFIKRALKSTKVKWGRSLLLFAVFTAILVFVLAGLTIRSAAEQAASEAQKEVGATVTLSANREASFQKPAETATSETDSDGTAQERIDPGSFSLTPVSLEDAQKIADLADVKSYSFESSASALASDGITAISSSDSTDSSAESTDENQPMGGGMPGGGQMTQADFQVTGVLASAQNSTFSSGTATITDGEGIDESDKDTNQVLIEQTLATANDLAVGDTFTITSSEDEETTYELTVKGIYESSESSNSMGMQFSMMNPSNTLYTSYTLANELNGTAEDNTIDSAVYTLADPENMDDFLAKAKKLIDTDTFSLQSNDAAYQSMLEPLNNVASFSKNVVLLVAVAGIIILTLIIMITIRERRHELGVLLSLGESRIKIILQLFTEVALCMILALGVAAVSGNVVANVVGQQLLEQQTSSEQNTQTNDAKSQRPDGENPGGRGGQMGAPGGSSNPFAVSDEVSELSINVTPTQIGFLALVALGISLLSVCLASIGILRLNPRKILLN
ncbi:ABC transporter permease [Enterococcus thailandicus]|uniref:ABC transporter permease n=1 Tax=Enterococcus thailandicus TaxID=417368 RepID=UPI0022EBC2CD|nr:ABC transporter permease [Enterococcus thailandicus]MDA3973998.1 ABC transporter permease [Enterococcus thailandicus]MDA3976192.1 ABC transporter permease [Enterococcus thailandicus]MDA3981157.1 ABC transporter permease [Enterococcus thailandicus]